MPASALRGLLPLAADGALLCVFVAAWAACATNAAAIAARWAWGEDSGVAAAATSASFVALAAAGVLAWVALPPFIWIVGTIVAEACREAQQQRRQRRGERTGARLQQGGGGIVPVPVLVVIFLTSIVLLGFLIQDPSPENRSSLQRAGSALSDIANFLASVMVCLVHLPSLIVQPRLFTAVNRR